MEKIKVNMSPNPLDVQTIHASQNDTEARQWEFELHNNGELIDTSEITEQMFFKAYKGGTEQLLPENTSTPTTSPFKGDIRYPQGLLTGQEFLYRQSPTESNGLAKITDVKGNTLVWNQLVKSDVATSTVNGVTFTNNNDNTWTLSGTATATAQKALIRTVDLITAVSGHKYLVKGGLPNGGSTKWLLQLYKNSGNTLVATDNGKGAIYTADSTTTNLSLYFTVYNGNTVSGKIYPQIFDLTKMGLDSITDPSDFTSLFPLSYYSYNQGSLLSFNGNGIKTVGANILDLSSEFDKAGVSYTVDEDGWFTVSDISYPSLYRSRFMLPLALTNGSALIEIDTSKTVSTNFRMILYNGTIRVATTTTKIENKAFDRISFDWSTAGSTTFRVMVTTMPTIGTYEPYTSSTLSLPISTYFPTGMKSAGNVYDELTESKAITRIGSVDLGSLTWVYDSAYTRFYTDGLGGSIKFVEHNEVANVLTNDYSAYSNDSAWRGNIDKSMWVSSRRFYMVNKSITDATAFKTAMSGVMLYYELATPTETSFTTASLVTENAEIPLSNEDGTLIGKCTEQLSAEPGFHDAKIKLSDSDGTCYSNKLQLHVERSPQ